MKKTPLMKAAEARVGKPLEQALPELLNSLGMTETAGHLGVDRPTLNYWLLRLGFTWSKVFVPPGFQVALVPKDAEEVPE